jgi:hypothetical protein
LVKHGSKNVSRRIDSYTNATCIDAYDERRKKSARLYQIANDISVIDDHIHALRELTVLFNPALSVAAKRFNAFDEAIRDYLSKVDFHLSKTFLNDNGLNLDTALNAVVEAYEEYEKICDVHRIEV